MPRIEGGADEVFTLIDDGGRVVGSVRGASIRVGAFATEDAAVEAALRGDRVIAEQLDGGRLPTRPTCAADVGLMHDGAYEWVVRERRPVARLIRPDVPIARDRALLPARTAGPGRPAESPHRHEAFGLEFVMPTTVSVATRLAIAQALHRALAAPGRAHTSRAHARGSTAHRIRTDVERTELGASRRALDERHGTDPTNPTPPAAA